MPYKDPAAAKACRVRNNHKKLAYMREYLAEHREENRVRSSAWYAANKADAIAQQKDYAKAHPEVNKAAVARYKAKNGEAIRLRAREAARKRRAEKRDECNAKNRSYVRQRRATDPVYQLKCRLRARLAKKLRGCGGKKFMSALDLTGCTTEFLRGYIEAQFKPGMSWNNIHVDHIVPLAAFDLTNEDEQRKAFHYQNLRPLFAKDNLAKGAKHL